MPRLVGRVAMRTLAIVAVSIGAACMALSVLPGSVWIPVGFATLGSLVMAPSFPALGGLLSSKVGPERQGSVMGDNNALSSSARRSGCWVDLRWPGWIPRCHFSIFSALAIAAVVLLAMRR